MNKKKKILTSLIITIIMISTCGLVFADNGETPNVTLNMTNEFTTTTEATTVTIKLGYGKVENLASGALVSFKGTLEYDTSIFSEVKVEGLNGYTATYAKETQRIIVDPKEPTASTEIANITFTLADGVEPCSTSVNFEIEEFTDGTNDFEFTNKEAKINIEKPDANNPEDDNNTDSTDGTENNTEQTNPETENTNNTGNNTSSTQQTNTEQTNTETTNTTNKTEDTLIIIDDEPTAGKEEQNQSNNQQNNTAKTSDTTTAKEEIPKTGAISFTLIILAFLIIGVISVIKFKNIEIE